MQAKRRPSKIRSALIIAAITVALLAAIEATCRLSESEPKYRASEVLGFELVPGYDDGDETVNAHGLRGREIGAKSPGSFRILAMGGSTTWGHKVENDETWPAYLEAALRDAGLENAEVLNGGVSGYGLEQIVRALRHRLLAELDPDLVLVYSGWNWPLMKENATLETFKRAAPSSKDRDWLHGFATVRWIEEKMDDLFPDLDVRLASREKMGDFLARFRTVMAEAFPALYEELASVCAEKGARVAVIAYPALVQVRLPNNGALTADQKDKLKRYGTEDDLEALVSAARDLYDYSIGVIRASAAGAGIPCLEGAARMEEIVRRPAPGGDFPERWVGCFRDHMHLAPAGNRALGEALAALLSENGCLDRP